MHATDIVQLLSPLFDIDLFFFWHFSGIKSPHAASTLSFHTSAPASSKQDFYQILGVPRTATQKEIKKAYYQVWPCLTYFYKLCWFSDNCHWQWVCVCCPSDGQKVSPWYQQRWPASQGKICSAGRSLWGLVSFFLQAFPWSTVGWSFILSDFWRLLQPFPVFHAGPERWR